MTFPQSTESGMFIQGMWPVAQCGERPGSYMCFTASKAVQEHSLTYVICCGLCVLGKKDNKKASTCALCCPYYCYHSRADCFFQNY